MNIILKWVEFCIVWKFTNLQKHIEYTFWVKLQELTRWLPHLPSYSSLLHMNLGLHQPCNCSNQKEEPEYSSLAELLLLQEKAIWYTAIFTSCIFLSMHVYNCKLCVSPELLKWEVPLPLVNFWIFTYFQLHQMVGTDTIHPFVNRWGHCPHIKTHKCGLQISIQSYFEVDMLNLRETKLSQLWS